MQDLLNSGGPMRLKKCRRGYMLYSMNDMTIGRLFDTYGEFSEPEVELLGKLVGPGHTVIEVGANIGALTVPLAEFVGPLGNVVVFEPQRIIYQNLCANIALNGLTNVRAVNAAVGLETSSVTLPKINYAEPAIFGAYSIEGATDGEQVQLIALDQFINTPHCRLIKIDVEGMEEQVVRGAAELIKEHQPILYVENDRQENSPSLIQTLFELDYKLYWHLPPLTREDNYFSHEKYFLPNIVSTNMLCSPPGLTIDGMDALKITTPDDWWENLDIRN